MGSQLAQAFTQLLSKLPRAPLGPKLLAERHGFTVGTASRFLRAIAEHDPIDVLHGIPGPVPLRRFLAVVTRSGLPPSSLRQAECAVDEFDKLIRQLGGDRSNLNAVLANWQPKSRKQFVLRRRQAAFKALAELKGASSQLNCTCFAIHPSSDEPYLDMLRIVGELGISRTRENASVYFGSRRVAAEGADVPPQLNTLTLDGHPVLDDLHSAQLKGFTPEVAAPIETKRVGEQVIHTLGPLEFNPNSRVDLLLAEVAKPGLRRRGEGFCTDPLSVFYVPGAPCKLMNLDLLTHEDAVPGGRAELLVYSIIPLGAATPGDPARIHDLVSIPETLEVGRASLDKLHLQGFPRYVDVVKHAFEKLGWNPRQFFSWRLTVEFPTPGSQFCIVLGRGASPSESSPAE